MTEAMEGVGRAVSQVKGSKKLGTLLEYVLALGNYLNGGTAQGGVYGVKLDVLLKVRGRTDGRSGQQAGVSLTERGWRVCSSRRSRAGTIRRRCWTFW